MRKARRLVSQRKLRTIDRDVPKGSVDLDLTQIHPRIVCMGYPSTGVRSLYRNKYDEVVRYLDFKYGEEYMVYNLCQETSYQYSKEKFYGRVRCFPFRDHTASPLRLMSAFVKDAKSYLAEHPKGVVVVHCKAGKGRTGVMVCCLLLEIEPSLQHLAEVVMLYYGGKRTSDGRGLTVPSQRRSVEYYERLMKEYGGNVPLRVPAIDIREIKFIDFPKNSVVDVIRLFVDSSTKPMWEGRIHDATTKADGVSSDRTLTVVQKGAEITTVALHGGEDPLLRAVSGDLRFELLDVCAQLVGILSVNTLFMESKYSGTGVDKLGKHCPESCCICFDFVLSV